MGRLVRLPAGGESGLVARAVNDKTAGRSGVTFQESMADWNDEEFHAVRCFGISVGCRQ